MKYGYSMKPVKDENMYNFDVNLYTKGDIGVNISTKIGDFYLGVLYGNLGSGEIGIHPYYYMNDKSVEVEAYYKSDESKYVSLWQEFNFNDFTLDVNITKNITVYKTVPVVFNKVYRRIVEEP